MLRIVIEDDRVQQQQPAPAPPSQSSELRSGSQPAVLAHPAQTAQPSRASAVNAGAPPGWLHEAVKGLVSKAAENTVKRSR
jgi:hypothetical protein